jgi:predicted ATPase
MITSLRLRNFKGWSDTGRLRLAPITVFFGTNSSGKSSIGQFLMMLKQTAHSPDRRQVLHPGDGTTAVDLGTMEDLIHQHEPSKELQFELRWKLSESLQINDALAKASFRGSEIEFEATIGFDSGGATQARCRRFSYRFVGDRDPEFEAGMVPDPKSAGKFRLDTKGIEMVRKTGRAWPLPPPMKFFGFPDEVASYYQNAAELGDLTLSLQSLLRGISYLGPLREEPRRHYPWAGDTPEDVGTRGERWVSAFLSGAKRKLSLGYKLRAKSFETLVAEELLQLGLIHSFKVIPLAKGVREYRVHIQVKEDSPSVSIPDVGFGVSQVLPVVVQCFYAPRNSTVVIEQPELHLHPAIQQNLADLFISAAKAREDGEDRGVQFLIESHSEHFLRRLQRRIAEGQIKNHEVAIYFCDATREGSSITPLQVDVFGHIQNWPQDFFGDQMTDIAEMQRAVLQSRSATPSIQGQR